MRQSRPLVKGAAKVARIDCPGGNHVSIILVVVVSDLRGRQLREPVVDLQRTKAHRLGVAVTEAEVRKTALVARASMPKCDQFAERRVTVDGVNLVRLIASVCRRSGLGIGSVIF